MGDNSFVTHDECEDYRKEYSDMLMEHNTRLVVLETIGKEMKNRMDIMIGAIVSGIGAIIVILLTRGI